MPDDGVISQDDAGDESGQLPTPPKVAADRVLSDDEGSASSSSPTQDSGPEEPEAVEPSGEPDANEQSPASPTGERILPDMSPAAFAERLLALERPRDAQQNVETRPPGGETVTFRSITVAEVYVGREADSFAAALGAIEWVKFNEPIVDEIARARKGDGYYRAQFVLASGPAPDLTLRGYGKVSLPEGIERVYGQNYVLGPSVVALVLTFVLTGAEAGRLDKALRDDAESKLVQPTPGTYAVMTVYQLKSERVRHMQGKLGERCLAWLKENFAGTLVAGGELGVPLCSLVSFAQGKPFQTQAPYMRLLDLTNRFFASRLARPDFLFLAPRIGRTRESEFIAGFNEADALSPGSYPVLSVTPEIFHEAISPFLIVEAVKGVLRSFESRMRDIRSDLEKLDFERATDSHVVGIRNKLLGISRDIAIVCGDLTAVVDDSVMFWADYPLLISVDPSQSPPTAESTADLTRSTIRSLVANVQSQETQLRELVLITSQAVNDVQNMRLQKNLGRLTIWLVILTAIVVVLTGVLVFQAVNPPTNTTSRGPTPHASTPATRTSSATPKT